MIWSKFILINWFLLQFVISTFAFIVLLEEHDYLIIRIFFIFCLIIVISFVAIITIFCSSLNSEAKNSHKLLTKLMSSKRLRVFPGIRIKVRLFIKTKHLNKCISQLMSCIERTAQNKIGFYCGKLFIMDQYRCCEVCIIYLAYLSLMFYLILVVGLNVYDDSQSWTNFLQMIHS